MHLKSRFPVQAARLALATALAVPAFATLAAGQVEKPQALDSHALSLQAPSGQALKPLVLIDRNPQDLADEQLQTGGHPDERWRLRGLYAHRLGRDEEAARHFQRAASYADKYSQYYLSLMYWHGQGVEKDRVQAYLWSDIASERGGRRLVAFRERMWESLTPEEQVQVTERGPALYAVYGDPAAKPRMERDLLRFRAQTTGSRLGYVSGKMEVNFGMEAGGSLGKAKVSPIAGGTTGDQYFAASRTTPDAYWAAKERELHLRTGGTGRVGDIRVGEIQDDAGQGDGLDTPAETLPVEAPQPRYERMQ